MKKILVIDDDQDISEVIQLILEEFAYASEIVTKGEEAYQRVKKYKPDLILLDILLSGIDGRTICKKLKNQKTTKNIPVIMVSAHPGIESTVKECGANDFLEKPFHMNKLLKKVKKYI
ncbi:MAG: response regulator [wastewater metagenome]|nr:response regulator [Candidatus Loosdrechtia aerotolerans]